MAKLTLRNGAHIIARETFRDKANPNIERRYALRSDGVVLHQHSHTYTTYSGQEARDTTGWTQTDTNVSPNLFHAMMAKLRNPS